MQRQPITRSLHAAALVMLASCALGAGPVLTIGHRGIGFGVEGGVHAFGLGADAGFSVTGEGPTSNTTTYVELDGSTLAFSGVPDLGIRSLNPFPGARLGLGAALDSDSALHATFDLDVGAGYHGSPSGCAAVVVSLSIGLRFVSGDSNGWLFVVAPRVDREWNPGCGL